MKSFERGGDAKIEKPPFVYHGSDAGTIEDFEPRKRFTPAEDVGELVYASDLPAFAAAHSFPWGTDEGFDLSINDGRIIFRVPVQFKERLMIPVFVYKLSSEQFDWNAQESTGHTLSSARQVKPSSIEQFSSVEEAIRHFGGEVIYKE